MSVTIRRGSVRRTISGSVTMSMPSRSSVAQLRHRTPSIITAQFQHPPVSHRARALQPSSTSISGDPFSSDKASRTLREPVIVRSFPSIMQRIWDGEPERGWNCRAPCGHPLMQMPHPMQPFPLVGQLTYCRQKPQCTQRSSRAITKRSKLIPKSARHRRRSY